VDTMPAALLLERIGQRAFPGGPRAVASIAIVRLRVEPDMSVLARQDTQADCGGMDIATCVNRT
jgi:hypothetical protein